MGGVKPPLIHTLSRSIHLPTMRLISVTPLGSKASELFNSFYPNTVAACTSDIVYKTKSLQSPE